MVQSFQELLFLLGTAFIIIFSLIYTYFCHAFKYWERRKVPSIKPSFPFGNAGSLFTCQKSFMEFSESLCSSTTEPFFGIYVFTLPRLVIRDPELVKMILVKDFENFQERATELVSNKEPVSIFMADGFRWKNRRKALSPAFTPGKVKLMRDTMIKCGEILQRHLKEKADKEQVLEFKDLATRYFTDITSSITLGIEVNSIENSEDEIRNFGRRIIEKSTIYEVFLHLIFFVIPELLRKLRLNVTKSEVEGFMANIVEQIIDYREKKNQHRNDLLQLMIQFRNNGKILEESDMKTETQRFKYMSIEDISREAVSFFNAGFEASSVIMSSFFYEMARHPSIRCKVQMEIDTCITKYGKFSYEAISEMKYLENCISETLRLYTVTPMLVRECGNDYKLPGYDTIVPKGMKVSIPISSLHRDPKYFPDPERFDPDRFSEERRRSILPYTYMPFGEGPRACIGMLLARMQLKIGIAMTLQKFDILKCSKTPEAIKPDMTNISRLHSGGIWLKVTHRKF